MPPGPGSARAKWPTYKGMECLGPAMIWVTSIAVALAPANGTITERGLRATQIRDR